MVIVFNKNKGDVMRKLLLIALTLMLSINCIAAEDTSEDIQEEVTLTEESGEPSDGSENLPEEVIIDETPEISPGGGYFRTDRRYN